MTSVAILGASGFGGAELMRIISGHPDLELRMAFGDSMAGTLVADLYPHLAPVVGETVFASYSPAAVDGIDIVFCALPHGASQQVMPDLLNRVGIVIDLAADYRLRDKSLYPTWYGEEHLQPELLGTFAYGLPELFREELVGSTRVAVPGCYPTSAALALAPLIGAGAIETTGVIVDAATGVSGAGRGAKPTNSFCTVEENFTAYGLINHRHTPEMEQATGAQILFTPHLAPMNRGILATCYARATDSTDTESLLGILEDHYRDEPFVVVNERPPATKSTLGSNSAHLSARFDPRTGHVIVLAAIDNIGKGASGQAVQCANIALGLAETTGLAIAGLAP